MHYHSYRGEHGPPAVGQPFRTRLGSISFGTERAARYYATRPNRTEDKVIAPRIIAAVLSIESPAMARSNDPFIEFEEIASIIGAERSHYIAYELHHHIENTNNWMDDIGLQYPSARVYLEDMPAALKRLYVDAYAVFDDARFTRWFVDAGYDGAIHSGSGATAGEVEYKIFLRECAKQIAEVRIG